MHNRLRLFKGKWFKKKIDREGDANGNNHGRYGQALLKAE
jgi:hypothetical protein